MILLNKKVKQIFWVLYQFDNQMAQRKIWTQQEDKILKTLYQEKGIKKWSHISKVLANQFGIMHRNGKQCRERYLNHLASGLKKGDWTKQQQQQLIKLHNRYGNRWAQISKQFQGRTDNCVKNQLYSKLRKSLRFVNDIIQTKLKKKFKQLKIDFIYKLIQMADQKYKSHPAVKPEASEQSYQLKNKILKLQCNSETYDLDRIILLIQSINRYNKTYKKRIPKRKLMKNDSNSQNQSQQQIQEEQIQHKKCEDEAFIKHNLPQTSINIKITQPPIQQMKAKQKQSSESILFLEDPNFMNIDKKRNFQIKIQNKPSNQSSSSKNVNRLHSLSIEKQSAFQTIINSFGNGNLKVDQNDQNLLFRKIDTSVHGQQSQFKVKKSRSSSNQDFPNILVDGNINEFKCSRLRSLGSIQADFEKQNSKSNKVSSIEQQFNSGQDVAIWLSQ